MSSCSKFPASASIKRLQQSMSLVADSERVFAEEQPIQFKGFINRLKQDYSQSKIKTMKKYTYNFTFEHNEQKKSSSVSLFANDILDANEKFAKLYSGDCGRYGAAQCNGIKMNVTGVDVEDIPVVNAKTK